jgi:hypothetical protein
MQAADEDTEAFSAPISGLSHGACPVSSGHFRPDSPNHGEDSPGAEGYSAGLLDMAGEIDGRFIVVPNVL